MPKETIPFTAFVEAAGPDHSEFIQQLHQFMLEQNCTVTIKEAKMGYVVSYVHTPTKRTVCNYVFRKKGPLLRIYGDNAASYLDLVNQLPVAMKDTIRAAGPCKRMLDPEACNPRCLMGFDFILDGQRQQKCRNSGFFFFLEDETKPWLKKMMEQEMAARNA